MEAGSSRSSSDLGGARTSTPAARRATAISPPIPREAPVTRALRMTVPLAVERVDRVLVALLHHGQPRFVLALDRAVVGLLVLEPHQLELDRLEEGLLGVRECAW